VKRAKAKGGAVVTRQGTKVDGNYSPLSKKLALQISRGVLIVFAWGSMKLFVHCVNIKYLCAVKIQMRSFCHIPLCIFNTFITYLQHFIMYFEYVI
jgi:hypothetical protein